MIHHPETIAVEAAGTRPAETWTTELAVLVHEIELYLTFWEHARAGRPIESQEEQS